MGDGSTYDHLFGDGSMVLSSRSGGTYDWAAHQQQFSIWQQMAAQAQETTSAYYGTPVWQQGMYGQVQQQNQSPYTSVGDYTPRFSGGFQIPQIPLIGTIGNLVASVGLQQLAFSAASAQGFDRPFGGLGRYDPLSAAYGSHMMFESWRAGGIGTPRDYIESAPMAALKAWDKTRLAAVLTNLRTAALGPNASPEDLMRASSDSARAAETMSDTMLSRGGLGMTLRGVLGMAGSLGMPSLPGLINPAATLGPALYHAASIGPGGVDPFGLKGSDTAATSLAILEASYRKLDGRENLEYTRGVSVGETGDIAIELARRGILASPLSVAEMAQHKDEIAKNKLDRQAGLVEQFKKVHGGAAPSTEEDVKMVSDIALQGAEGELRNSRIVEQLGGMHKIVNSLKDIFGDKKGISELILNLDEMTAGALKEMSPDAIHQLAQRVTEVSRITGIATPLITASAAIAANRSRAMGLSGSSGTDIALQAALAGKAFSDMSAMAPEKIFFGSTTEQATVARFTKRIQDAQQSPMGVTLAGQIAGFRVLGNIQKFDSNLSQEDLILKHAAVSKDPAEKAFLERYARAVSGDSNEAGFLASVTTGGTPEFNQMQDIQNRRGLPQDVVGMLRSSEAIDTRKELSDSKLISALHNLQMNEVRDRLEHAVLSVFSGAKGVKPGSETRLAKAVVKGFLASSAGSGPEAIRTNIEDSLVSEDIAPDEARRFSGLARVPMGVTAAAFNYGTEEEILAQYSSQAEKYRKNLAGIAESRAIATELFTVAGMGPQSWSHKLYDSITSAGTGPLIEHMADFVDNKKVKELGSVIARYNKTGALPGTAAYAKAVTDAIADPGALKLFQDISKDLGQKVDKSGAPAAASDEIISRFLSMVPEGPGRDALARKLREKADEKSAPLNLLEIQETVDTARRGFSVNPTVLGGFNRKASSSLAAVQSFMNSGANLVGPLAQTERGHEVMAALQAKEDSRKGVKISGSVTLKRTQGDAGAPSESIEFDDTEIISRLT